MKIIGKGMVDESCLTSVVHAGRRGRGGGGGGGGGKDGESRDLQVCKLLCNHQNVEAMLGAGSTFLPQLSPSRSSPPPPPPNPSLFFNMESTAQPRMWAE